MRVKRRTDFEAISRRSVQRDFYPERIYLDKRKTPETQKKPQITINAEPRDNAVYRIASINPVCEYIKFARYFCNKLVRLVERKGTGDSTTGWYEFVHDADRQALNQAAGWSDNKNRYFLERPKFK